MFIQTLVKGVFDLQIDKRNVFCLMVFYDTFNNISVLLWRSDLLVEETGVPWENHRPAASDWQTLSHSVISSTPSYEHWLHR